MIFDAHVRVGAGREVELDADALLATMDELGIDRALVSPGEAEIAWANRAGNERVAALAREHADRLAPYAVANPWAGPAAVEELRRAREDGAVGLAVDPALQGFDLLDGLVDPLLDFAEEAGWLAYVRAGTPPTGLPLQVAELARRHPGVPIVMGRSGATDFIIDAQPALQRASNLYADTSHIAWDTLLSALAADPAIGVGRILFATDAPYALPVGELERTREWPLPEADLERVLGGNLEAVLRRTA